MKTKIYSKIIITSVFILYLVIAQVTFAKIYHAPNSNQEIKLIDNGEEAFFHRYRLLDEARTSINIEYFIFNTKGDSTKLILRKLIDKAQQGVSIRILLDDFYYNIPATLANELLEAGIKIKKYNPAFLLTVKAQHRNHRKLFSIDNKKAIIGGRNVSDEYFDLGESFNFHDRDVLIKGDLVSAMDESFENYWTHQYSKSVVYKDRPRRPSGSKHSKSSHAVRRYKRWLISERTSKDYLYKKVSELEMIKENLLLAGKKSSDLNLVYTCNDSLFVTDDPGKTGSKNKDSALYLYERLRTIRSSVKIETPYFVPKEEEYEIFQTLLESGKDISLITNGINGTDAALISALFLDRVSFFTDRGMKAYIHDGRNLFNIGDERLWALHNKTFIFDNQDVIIGSYNLDPRSQRFNSEMLFVCKNNLEFTHLINEKFDLNALKSIPIGPDGTPSYEEDDSLRYRFKVTSSNMLKHILKFFDFLL